MHLLRDNIDSVFISLLQILTFCWHDVHVLAPVAVLAIDMASIHFISLLCPCNLHSFWNINANPAINIPLVCVISWNCTKGNDFCMTKNVQRWYVFIVRWRWLWPIQSTKCQILSGCGWQKTWKAPIRIDGVPAMTWIMYIMNTYQTYNFS